MTDRTSDFSQLCQQYAASTPSHSQVKRPPPTAQETAQFSAAASDISIQVHRTSSRLQELTKLVRQNNMFNDPSQQINELVSHIKEDITSINTQLDNLELYTNSTSASSKQSSDHSHMIVSQMKTELMNTTKGFKDILQVRQENMKLQQNRRARYGQLTPQLGKPLNFTQTLPRPKGINDPSESQEIVPLIATQAQETVVDQSYVDARAEAVSNIESHIVELGSIFNRLAVMINEQGEMVERIDDNVEDTVMNVESGQAELLRYFQNLSDNRMLAMKVSAILLAFVIFFMFFMA